MKTMRRTQWGWIGGLGLALALTGCQTWTSGMTLPSGHYLQHPPQYFPPDPAFPLTRELSSMELNQPQPGPGLVPPVRAPLPPPVPPPLPGGGGGVPPGP
jgi:hypothetical protein